MTVLSALFEKIAARIPDAAQAKALVAEGAKADPSLWEHQQLMKEAAGLAPKEAASMQLIGLSNEAYVIGNALQKMKLPLTITTSSEDDETAENSWESPAKSVTFELLHEEKRLMLFKASRNEAGGFYIEAEENGGNAAFSLSMMNNRPAADIAEVQQALATHLDSSFRIPADEAAIALARLIDTVDFRPQLFIDILKAKPFDDVLRFINKGINAAHVHDEYPGNFVPLDFVLMSPFKGEERRALLEAVVAQGKTGDRLVTPMTMRQAVSHDAVELLPRLLELGGTLNADHFSQANSLAMLQALRPYTFDVNAGRYGDSAGRNAAYRADLESFKWLETQGLDRDARAGHNMTTYVHNLVGGSRREGVQKAGGDDTWPAFLHYLIDNGYPIDVGGPAGTPLKLAVQTGELDLAKVLIDAGAKVTPSLMEDAVLPVFAKRVTPADAANFMTYLHEQHAVPYTQEAAQAPFNFLSNAMDYATARWDALKPLGDMLDFLKTKGVTPVDTPENTELRKNAAEKLRGADEKALGSFGIEALPVIKRGARNPRPTP